MSIARLIKSEGDKRVLDHLGITDEDLTIGKEYTFTVQDISAKDSIIRTDKITIGALESEDYYYVFLASKHRGIGSPNSLREYPEYQNGTLKQEVLKTK
ncbi:hypothetical protein [Virgibacillus salexigens]|uniref:hypothetical protein n=1 Tax=Virgibacillus salexigens TaxID=61016 RepID=UPI0030818C0D